MSFNPQPEALRSGRAGTHTALVLRPLEIKQFFDFGIRIYRLNFLPMLLAMVLLQAPMAVLTTLLVYRLTIVSNNIKTGVMQDISPEQFFLEDLDAWLLLGGLFVVGMFYQLLVLPLAHISVSKLALQTLHGEPWTLRQAMSFARARYWQMQVALATFLLPLLLLSVVVLLPVLALTGVGTDAVLSAALGAMGVIWLGIIATWIMYFRFFPALTGALQATEEPPGHGVVAQGIWYLKRAYGVTDRYFWRCVGVLLLLYLALGFVQQGIQQGVELLSWMFYLGFSWPEDGDALALLSQGSEPTVAAVTMVITSVFSLLFPAFTAVYQFLLYYDLRMRKEGLDLHVVLDHALTRRQPAAAEAEPALSSSNA